MTEYVKFSPDDKDKFQFTANIGGKILFVSVPYNRYVNRYYVRLKTDSNNIVSLVPLIASPDGFDINLALAYAPGSLVYRKSTNNFEIK